MDEYHRQYPHDADHQRQCCHVDEPIDDEHPIQPAACAEHASRRKDAEPQGHAQLYRPQEHAVVEAGHGPRHRAPVHVQPRPSAQLAAAGELQPAAAARAGGQGARRDEDELRGAQRLAERHPSGVHGDDGEQIVRAHGHNVRQPHEAHRQHDDQRLDNVADIM